MGLIKALFGAAFSTVSDTWKDYIYCDSMENNILVKKGRHKSQPGNIKYGNENVITDGSCIAVNEGQFLILVENGKIIDYTAEPGGYIWNSGTEKSFFGGTFGDGLRTSAESFAERLQYGGIAANDQRAYFINTKEILNNRFGFGKVPFRDHEFNITVLLQGYGNYSYRIVDPIRFFYNVASNVKDTYITDDLSLQLRSELQGCILPVLGGMAEVASSYDRIVLNTGTIVKELNDELSGLWQDNRGIAVSNISFSSILPDDESVDKIRSLQESRIYSENKTMLGARVGAAQANAMEDAANNHSGSVNAFMGVNMAANAGGINANELLKEEEPPKPVNDDEVWICECGERNIRKFCPECGRKKPDKPSYICQKCGADMSDLGKVPKFCYSCGNPMNQ